MTNIELYINKTLCDIQSPEKLGVRLNRVLINPAELNTKDAQYSYSITIPATPVNDAIFGYANVEEVKNKFNRPYTAQLYIDSVRIFDGLFKLSEIDSDGNYKGNLVVPAKKTIKEIFGDKKMTEIPGEWKLDLKNPIKQDEPLGMVEMMNKFNTDKGTPQCIFPLVLYGLLPKVPDEKEEYSGKTLWDKHVRLGIQDFPPSINCMQAIRMIFENSGYDIIGSAFSDDRLNNLYMSYVNPTNYQQEWNWGHLGHFKIHGEWTNINNDNKDIPLSSLETEFCQTKGDYEHVAVNLLRAKNSEITIEKEQGTTISQWQTKKKDNSIIQNTDIVIPASGLYKVTFSATMQVESSADSGNEGSSNKDLGLRFAYANSYKAHNEFDSGRYELKVVRDRANGDFGIDQSVIDGVFYKNNQNQEMDKKGQDKDETHGFPLFETSPKYFPQALPDAVLFVDPVQNPKIISGFRWGRGDIDSAANPVDKDEFHCNILAAKNGFSWDKTDTTFTYSAVKSPAYWRYGVLQKGEEKYEAGTEPEETVKEYGYEICDRFKIDLELPNGYTDNFISKESNSKGSGLVHSIIWLEKGERITVVDVSDLGVWRSGSSHKAKGAYIKHSVKFDLEIEPYRTKADWLTVNFEGTGTDKMSWNDPSEFKTDYINLIKFLPSEQKIDDWLENFCKAFNLQLTQPKDGTFELSLKQASPAASAASLLDLDGKASILGRTNQPLGLPREFQLGFRINQEEQGYVETKNNNTPEDGGGSFFTGNLDGQVVPQSSNFSYNWFKEITQEKVVYVPLIPGLPIMIPKKTKQKLELPVITNFEIWKQKDTKDYAEMVKKLYTNYVQRFWYRKNDAENDNNIYKVGEVWRNKVNLELPILRNELNGQNKLTLNYHDEPHSILSTYFNIIASDDSNYTYIECHLTPDEYEQLDGNKLVKLNGDLYYISAVEGYDPMGRNKTKLKLIRKV